MEQNNTKDGEIVLAALTDSEAYQNFNIAKNSVEKSCISYRNNNITNLEYSIKEYSKEGSTEIKYNLRYNPKYETNKRDYLTMDQINDIVSHFKNKGYFIEFKLQYFHWYERFFKRNYNKVQFKISWDFSDSSIKD